MLILIYIIDSIFTEHTKRDFTFKDRTAINKIGFKKFDLSFCVINEEYWFNLANDKEYNQFHDNQILPPNYFFTSGSTDFDKEEDSFWDNCIIN